MQGIKSSRDVLYVGHGSVVVAHHLLHEIGIASHFHALTEQCENNSESRGKKTCEANLAKHSGIPHDLSDFGI